MKKVLKYSQRFGFETFSWSVKLFTYSLLYPIPISWLFRLLAKNVKFLNTCQMLVHTLLMDLDQYLRIQRTNHNYNDMQ